MPSELGGQIGVVNSPPSLLLLRPRKIEQMNSEKLTELIKKEMKGKPFKKMPLPRLVSKRPIFIG